MKNKKWKRFDQLTSVCMNHMAGVNADGTCWQKAFQLLKEILEEERSMNPEFAREWNQLDDETDFQYDVQGWMEDCLGELDLRGEYRMILTICDWVLESFDWKAESDSQFRFERAEALGNLGLVEEADLYCEKWVGEEPDNPQAAAALIYAKIKNEEPDGAKEAVRRYLPEGTECTDENCVLFYAAERLYEWCKDKKALKQIRQEIEKYDEFVEDSWLDEELPFV